MHAFYACMHFRVAESVEISLELQGVTGVEDKLQDGVGETLEALILGGVKVGVYVEFLRLPSCICI